MQRKNYISSEKGMYEGGILCQAASPVSNSKWLKPEGPFPYRTGWSPLFGRSRAFCRFRALLYALRGCHLTHFGLLAPAWPNPFWSFEI